MKLETLIEPAQPGLSPVPARIEVEKSDDVWIVRFLSPIDDQMRFLAARNPAQVVNCVTVGSYT